MEEYSNLCVISNWKNQKKLDYRAKKHFWISDEAKQKALENIKLDRQN